MAPHAGQLNFPPGSGDGRSTQNLLWQTEQESCSSGGMMTIPG